jgi:DNA (cytosine-5)-methyltransferase 1
VAEIEQPRQAAKYRVVEICAGAGGQSLGLEKAGFEHAIAVEIDKYAAATLRTNRKHWTVAEGDVADPSVWTPEDHQGIDLLAGGVPCPPFSIAGKQLGASDERDLFAWAIELAARIRPRALLLENVRGLAAPRFAAYRQRVLDRLAELGYVADWRLLQASDFGLPQLRPRFVLVGLREDDADFFHWPEHLGNTETVGTSLRELMGSNDWKHVEAWAQLANGVGPTLVGGSKKHGGADLGPTRAKSAWLNLAVDGRGIADKPPGPNAPHPRLVPPRLTIEMVAKLQGWRIGEWVFNGGKTAKYRQIGNAFPPPVAEALGVAFVRCFDRSTTSQADFGNRLEITHDKVYSLLRAQNMSISAEQILQLLNHELDQAQLERCLTHLERDFEVEVEVSRLADSTRYRLGDFKGFVGQTDHVRHRFLSEHGERVS